MQEPIRTLSFSRQDAPTFFPQALWQVERPPRTLHLQGKESAFRLLERLPERGLGIVGSRGGQPRSKQVIEDVLGPMQGFDWIIVSGLAKGVDAAAHDLALKNGFPTVAILGCGLGVEYPAENSGLRRRILESGGVIATELPRDHEPVPWAFIHRNRLISGWSNATWVVQASFRSGALNTASWALRQERALFATPGFPGDPALAGNQRLLASGQAKCAWNSRCFGQVWLEVESFLAEKRGAVQARQRTRERTACPSHESDLADEIARMTREEGGARFTELLSWALGLGWPAERFFKALQHLVESGQQIKSENGILVFRSNIAIGERT